MKPSASRRDYVSRRWKTWLGGVFAASDLSRTAFATLVGASPHAVGAWLGLPKADGAPRERMVTAQAAFSVGQRVASEPRLKQYADGIIALYASGYLGFLASCLLAEIIRVLERYPNRERVEADGLGDPREEVSRRMRYLLACAVGLPYACADLDNVSEEAIPSAERRVWLGAIAHLSERQFCEDTCRARVTARGAQPKDSRGAQPNDSLEVTGILTLDDTEALEWTRLQDRLSRIAQRDDVLRLYYSTSRKEVDEYRRRVYDVAHYKQR